MYENGEGTTIDIQKALVWYKLASDQGNEFSRKKIKEMTHKSNVIVDHEESNSNNISPATIFLY